MSPENSRILLVKPPFFRAYHIDASLNRLPLSLAYLTAVIREKRPHWDVKIYNSDFSPKDHHLSLEYLTGVGFDNYRRTIDNPKSKIWQEIEDKIREFNPSVVGITTTSQTFAATLAVASIAKFINQNIQVLVGGPHPSIFGKGILKENVIDIAIIREGEETIIELLDFFEGSKDLSRIEGIAYREGEDLIENPKRPLIQDLDCLPFPISVAQKCLMGVEKYPPQAFKYIMASRGCPFSCAFCDSRNVWSRKVRTRFVRSVLKEIEKIREFGINYVHFIDDTWGIEKRFVRELCESLQALRPRLKWACETHVSCVDDETIKMMRDSGCRMIQIGVESGNNSILKSINKGITIEQAFSAARTIKKHGIYLQTFFMVGFPDETEETLDDTILAMKEIPTDQIIYSTFTPSIGANSFHDGGEVVPLSADFDATLYHHQSPANYFCRNIPEEVFSKRLRRLERTLDKLNSRKNFRVFMSREGFLRMREKGFARTLRRVVQFGKSSLRWS